MTSEQVATVAMWFATGLNLFIVIFVSIPAHLRDIREFRKTCHLRESIWAYEKELREHGVSLPARCVCCCQVLPRHVEGCDLRDRFLVEGTLLERITRPPQYDPSKRVH